MTCKPSPTPSPPKQDPFYGHESIAKLCARYITHLFACPESPPASTQSQSKLPFFVAYALHRTKLHKSVTFAALALLQRLKARFPAARGSSGHRLFISAFMIASKVICDDTYSNKSWSVVAQGMFALREINQMEREMCAYLEWQITLEPAVLADFEASVKRDFGHGRPGPGPYPAYSPSVARNVVVANSSSTSTDPSQRHPTSHAPPSTSSTDRTPTTIPKIPPNTDKWLCKLTNHVSSASTFTSRCLTRPRVSHLTVWTTLIGLAQAAAVDPPPPPEHHDHTCTLRILLPVLVFCILLFSLIAVWWVRRRTTTHHHRTPHTRTPAPAPTSTVPFPSPAHLRSSSSTAPPPILTLANSLTATPLPPQPRRRGWANPEIVIAVVSAVLTLIGLVIGGVSLLYARLQVSKA